MHVKNFDYIHVHITYVCKVIDSPYIYLYYNIDLANKFSHENLFDILPKIHDDAAALRPFRYINSHRIDTLLTHLILRFVYGRWREPPRHCVFSSLVHCILINPYNNITYSCRIYAWHANDEWRINYTLPCSG